MSTLEGSVGDDGDNHFTDVLYVQILLNRFILAGVMPGVMPLFPNPFVTDGMIIAIEAFQASVMGHNNPDGRVDKDGKTFQRLLGPIPSAVDPVPKSSKSKWPVPTAPNTAGTESFGFPFPREPSLHWTGGSRYFGAPRGKKKNRAHAGCDLIFPKGTAIHAIAAGKHARGPYVFTSPESDPPYPLTHAVEIQHGPILVRYGEIEPGSYIGSKQEITQGKVIAKVGALKMLHLEVYTDGNARGALSNSVLPYKRRADLTDPDSYLRLWSKNLPTAP